MDRLEHGRILVGRVDAARSGVADATDHGTGLVGDDVAEEVVGQDHVEAGRVGHQEDGGRVDVQVVVGDLRVFLGHLVDDALPHVAGVDQHVLLVHEGHVLPALHGQLEGVTHHALHAVGGVDGDFGGHLVRGATTDRAAGTAVQAFGAFTHHDEVDVTRVGERRRDTLVQLGRTQVHVLVQVEAELEQQAAFQNARLDARIADGAQQDGVGLLDALLFLLGEDRAVTQIAFGTEVEMLVIEFGDAFGRLLQSLLGPRSHFLANAIARNDGDGVLLCRITHSTRL